VEAHQVIDPRSRRLGAKLTVLGIDDKVEATARHRHPALLLESVKRVVGGHGRGLERGFGFRPRERAAASGQKTFDVRARSRFHSFANYSDDR